MVDKLKKYPSPILGEKVRLRLIQEEDLERLRRWRNENRSYFFDSRYITKEGQQNWYANVYLKKDNDLIFIIESGGKPIGTVSLYLIDLSAGQAEFGRMVIGDLKSRRKGLAQDASKALIRWGFSDLGLRKIVLEVLANNQPAICLYEKIGFQKTPVEGDDSAEEISMVIGKKAFKIFAK